MGNSTISMAIFHCYVSSYILLHLIVRFHEDLSPWAQPSHPAAIPADQSWTVPKATGSDLARFRGEWNAGRAKKMDGVVLLFWLPFGNLSHSYWTWPKIQLIELLNMVWFSIVMSTFTRGYVLNTDDLTHLPTEVAMTTRCSAEIGQVLGVGFLYPHMAMK